MIALTSFQLKWLERLILHHMTEDNNMQPKLSVSQYGFRGGFLWKLLCMSLCVVYSTALLKNSRLWVFFWIFLVHLTTPRSMDCCGSAGLDMSKILTPWIENLLRHRSVQVELYDDIIKREVVKVNPQGGILFPFL